MTMIQLPWDGTVNMLEVYNVCPFCHRGMNPTLKSHVGSEKKDGIVHNFLVIWRCTVNECLKDVVTFYEYERADLGKMFFKFKEFLNGTPELPKWPEVIMNLKNGNPDDLAIPEQSKFIDIYFQSISAEFKRLNEIAGIGFRRALEFLIKDYAIQEHSSKIVEIKKAPLLQVVKEYYPSDLFDIM